MLLCFECVVVFWTMFWFMWKAVYIYQTDKVPSNSIKHTKKDTYTVVLIHKIQSIGDRKKLFYLQ